MGPTQTPSASIAGVFAAVVVVATFFPVLAYIHADSVGTNAVPAMQAFAALIFIGGGADGVVDAAAVRCRA